MKRRTCGLAIWLPWIGLTTKEVFANYFAARIVEPLFPEINHTQNKLKTFTAASLSEDRTMGTNAIRQPLDNLRNAGLIYGQIIYNKAPVMMEKLVDKMGEANFRSGIQEYLKTYSYGNATWDDLIRILDSKTTEDLAAFSDVWVNRKGMPTLTFRTGIALAATFCRHSLRRARFGDPGEYDRYPVPDATSVCAFARIAQYRWQRLWGICARRACSALAGGTLVGDRR